jgi:CMP-N-acetylneuraminic acid synthetase
MGVDAVKLAIQIPVKARSSERCPGKNFRKFNGEPLWLHAAQKAKNVAFLLNSDPSAKVNVDVFIDSEGDIASDDFLKQSSDEALAQAGLLPHHRHPIYAEDWANGNHLLNQFVVHHPEYDWYGQLFVTAPFLRVRTIVDLIRHGIANDYPSVFTAAPRAEMLWVGSEPVTSDPYRMDGEMRTQEMQVFRQTHGFYLTRGDVARRTGSRIGQGGRMRIVSEREAFDIDTEEDFAEAVRLLEAEKVKEPELPYER